MNARHGDARRLILRFIFGLLALVALVTVLAQTLRSELEALGQEFVDQAGYAGMAVGTLLADGFFFPIPPQFFMLLAIASDTPAVWTLSSISVGSVLGGISGFFVAKRLSRLTWLKDRITSASALKALQGKVGLKGIAFLSVTPIAFSWLIYFCGLGRYPYRFVVLLCTLRIPKLVLYYWLVQAGWAS